ncbi:MAG: two-component sensor histidine kinase, partial [Jatrophihabitans endophyticus]
MAADSATSALAPLRAGSHAVRREAVRTGRVLLAAWRGSLQLRVGATTVVVTGVMVLLIGLFLVDKVSSGILNAKSDAAVR